jgi:catechol 2,3-dioxygenase-like lactoylglutathione lyase family enzyme
MTPDNALERGALPRLRGVDHIGITVPDLDEATKFFVDVLGCEVYYSLGPFSFPEGNDWMSENLDVDARAEISEIRILRCANGAHFELLKFIAPEQRTQVPRFSDYGGYHIAFYVDDIEVAVAHLKSKGIKVLGPIKGGIGPEAGEQSTFIHFKTPWGLMLEFVSFPQGRAYEKETPAMWIPAESPG